ncbi:MAG: hypothetical protein HYX72_09015 [Acidobacteria bacterium]|nr:hypothetical protein [Acidobacteriota bacterium]
MVSDANGNGQRDRALIKRRKQRLNAIARLDPISKAVFSSAVESDEKTTETLPVHQDREREQHLRDIQGKLKAGTYSVPADQLAAILTRIFLSVGQQQGSPNTAAEVSRSEDPDSPPFPDDPDRML